MKRSTYIRWFLKRPRYYGVFLYTLYQELRRKIRGISQEDLDQERAEGLDWCQRIAVEREEAFRRLFGDSQRLSIYEEFEDELVASNEIAANCPVKMGGAGDLDLLYQLSEHLQARYVIETGVAYGWSSLAILLSLQKRQAAILISTDMPYTSPQADQFVGCVVPARLRDHWELIPYPDRVALPKAINQVTAIDLFHYDSDKRYEGRMWANPIVWEVLRPGGIFVSDDINDNLAFRDFCILIDREPIVYRYGNKFVGIVEK
jgi:predicted O-methyltransferase YrrM